MTSVVQDMKLLVSKRCAACLILNSKRWGGPVVHDDGSTSPLPNASSCAGGQVADKVRAMNALEADCSPYQRPEHAQETPGRFLAAFVVRILAGAPSSELFDARLDESRKLCQSCPHQWIGRAA